MMKDVFGNELNIGDTVAFTEPGYTYELKVGIIVKFTPKKVVIGWNSPSGLNNKDYPMQTYKFSKQLAKQVG